MENEKPWYETEEDRIYEDAVKKIKAAVLEDSVPFDKAASQVEVENEQLKSSVVSDALKLLIAELHFMKQIPLDEVADALKLPLKKVEDARKEMIAEVEAAAIEKYKESLNQGGNA